MTQDVAVQEAGAVAAPAAAGTASAVRTTARAVARSGARRRADAVRELPVAASEDAWTPDELDGVRAELDAEVVRLSADVAAATSSFSALVSAGGEGAGDDQVDHGAATAGREHEMTIVNNARDLLEQTQRALVRLASGAYGTCESCSGPIGKARLQAFPRVTLCVGCKARAERR
ncbi:TraR/DksA family transcriptional regulator [Kineococcus sp. SYSU DK004]|uniref:TraR/DksA family transcriptional regulator n=1 Tax=Kineococcus sp. SYSU DK004 TaxID=3383125 RepID=UPI003D7D43F2